MALDIARMQILASPIKARREGIAFRNAAAAEKQEAQLRNLAIERAELENASLRNPTPDPAERRAQTKFDREQVAGAMDLGIEYQGRALHTYQNRLEETQDPQVALADAQAIFDQGKAAFSNMYPDLAAQGLYDDDGRFDPRQAASMIQTAESMRSQLPGERAQFLSPEEKASVGLPEEGVYARQPDGRIQEMFRPTETDAKQREKEQMREQLVEMGVPPERAFAMAYNFERMEMTDVGTIRLMNEIDQTAIEIPVGALDDGPIEVSDDRGHTLWDLAPLGTGLGSGAVQAYNVAFGTLGFPVNEKVAEARQAITAEYGALRRALASNKRYPVAEMNRLEEEAKLKPNVFLAPSLFRSNLRATADVLTRRMEYEQRAADDPSLSDDDRKEARRAAEDIRNFLDVTGVPDEDVPMIRSASDWDAVEVGAVVQDANGVRWRKGADGQPERVE